MTIYRKQPGLFLMLGLVCLLLTGCTGLPTLNLSREGTPTEAVTEFLNAVIAESKDDLSESVYNYDWRSEDALDSQTVSETDLAVIACIRESRSFTVLNETVTDSHHADVKVRYTCFNLKEFQDKLTELVLTDVKNRQYNGEVFSDFSDTTPIIESYKKELLAEPSSFYTTKDYHITTISSKGRWRLVMTDEFYNALTGYTK